MINPFYLDLTKVYMMDMTVDYFVPNLENSGTLSQYSGNV